MKKLTNNGKGSKRVERIDKDKPILPNEDGIVRLLEKIAHNVIDSVRLDTFTNTIFVKELLPWSKNKNDKDRAWTEDDTICCAIFLQKNGLHIKTVQVDLAIRVIARRHEYHPLKSYLNNLFWDKQPRIDNWLIDYFGATNDVDYLKVVGSKFLISAVARIMEPGCKVDTMLILEGKQGIGKSQALAILAKKKLYFTDSVYTLENNNIFELIRGKWIVEISELDAMRSLRATRLKQFITSQVDIYRPPYARYSIRQPRQCVFVGTTNEQEYLKDETGGRRFWPIECSKINKDKLRQDVDQLWAEALVRYTKNETWWTDTEEDNKLVFKQQELRIERDPWMSKIDSCLRYAFDILDQKIVSVEQILTSTDDSGMNMAETAVTRQDRNRVIACAKILGCYEYTRLSVDGERMYGFVRGDTYICK